MLERYWANINFWGYFKTIEKLIKNSNELLLVGSSKTNNLDQKQFGLD